MIDAFPGGKREADLQPPHLRQRARKGITRTERAVAVRRNRAENRLCNRCLDADGDRGDIARKRVAKFRVVEAQVRAAAVRARRQRTRRRFLAAITSESR